MLNKGFFGLARNISRLSMCRVKVGAVISKKSAISSGFNIERTHPLFCNPALGDNISIHAEMIALINAGYDINGCDIWIYREYFDNTPALARPCDVCYNQLRMHGIKKIYYTVPEYPYWKCEKI